MWTWNAVISRFGGNVVQLGSQVEVSLAVASTSHERVGEKAVMEK